MEKLLITRRSNWEGGFYIKIKAEKKSMKVIKKFVEEVGDDYFTDNQIIPRSFSQYDMWKDFWIPVSTKEVGIDLVCGDKYIHMLFNRFLDLERINAVLNKYCDWVKPQYKKSFVKKIIKKQQ